MKPRAMWSSLDLFWDVPAVLSKSALLREVAVLIEVPFPFKGSVGSVTVPCGLAVSTTPKKVREASRRR